jgi:integrase
VYICPMQSAHDWKGCVAMSVKRISGRWRYRCVVQAPDGTKTRISGSAPAYEDTKQKALELERTHAERVRTLGLGAATEGSQPNHTLILESSKPLVPTLRDFGATYLETCTLKPNKPSTVESKAALLRLHIEPYLGHLRLDQVTYAAIEDLKLALAKTPAANARSKPRMLSAKTINNCLNVLGHLLTIAHKRDLIGTAPDVECLRIEPPKFDFLDFGEAKRLIGACVGAWRTFFLVALRTGMRRGEMLALRWQDVDLVNGRITVRQNFVRGKTGTPKSGKPREIPLGDDVLDALKAHHHARGPLVFCTAEGHRLTPGKIVRALASACKRAELERVIGPHVCRHTFASHLVMRGVPMRVVQELMGHASIVMTMRYAHLAPTVARDAVRLLDGFTAPGWSGSPAPSATPN